MKFYSELDIRIFLHQVGISKRGDVMVRYHLCEAVNVMLSTVKKRFALRSLGLKPMNLKTAVGYG